MVAITLAGAAVAAAQQPLWTLQGDEPGEILGHALASLPDVNGNGRAELVVSSLGRRVEIRDGLDGTLIDTLLPPVLLNTFGHAVADAGDVNGDGVHDILVGAPEKLVVPCDGTCPTFCTGSCHLPAPGQAFVYSGMDGSILFELSLSGTTDDEFGWDVTGVGDVNSDAHGDFAVSTTFLEDGAIWRPGLVLVYSGLDGHVLRIFSGTAADSFGYALAVLDVDGDGINEIAIGAPVGTSGGASTVADHVQVWSIATGALLVDFPEGQTSTIGFGADLAPAGDVDGDGTPDLMVAQPSVDGQVGAASVYSGRTWTQIVKVAPKTPNPGYVTINQWLTAFRVAGGADVTGDGRPDVLVAFQDHSALVVHGAEGEHVGGVGAFAPVIYYGLHPTHWGTVPALLPDVTGDGIAEVAIGEPLLDPVPRVTIYPGGHWPWKNLGYEHPGVAGDWQRLVGIGSLIAGSYIILQTEPVNAVSPPYSPPLGWLVAGGTEVTHAFKGGVLVPQPTLLWLQQLALTKVNHLVENLVPSGLPSGVSVTFQLLLADPGAPPGLTFSNAVRATLP